MLMRIRVNRIYDVMQILLANQTEALASISILY